MSTHSVILVSSLSHKLAQSSACEEGGFQLNGLPRHAAEGISVEAPAARAASGQLSMRQRRSTRSAAHAQAGAAAAGASGRAKGIRGGVGLDTPYEWGKA